MKRSFVALATLVVLAACTVPGTLTGMPAGMSTQAADAAAYGGLAADVAAHPSVQLARPKAYALTSAAAPFLAALTRTVEPQRQALAARLQEDALVSRGLASWERAGTATQEAVLARIAAIQAEIMGCQVPTIVTMSGQPEQSGMMAYFEPAGGPHGRIVLYPDTMARGGKYLAVATLVHEMRHAAQYQLLQSNQWNAGTDLHVLAEAYTASWQAISDYGGQASLAYGDYAHLNMEFDAFQTGNQVAAILSQGTFRPNGYGFSDTHYREHGVPVVDLLDMRKSLADYALIAAVNRAEAQAARSYGGQVLRPRPRSFMPPTGWRRVGR